MRLAATQDLIAGALGLAYKYVGLPELREAFKALEGRNGSEPRPGELVDALASKGLAGPRAEKLRRASRLAGLLKDDAIYGMIALRNRLVGTTMLNACMEESRKNGFTRTLSDLLREKGVVTEELDRSIKEKREAALSQLSNVVRDLARSVDFAGDEPAVAERKLAVLLGEVATGVSFLSREELESCLGAEDRVRRGLPADEAPAAAPEPPAPEVTGTGAHAALPAGTAAAASTDDEPIKGYELMERLGSGAMGAVLKARKKDTGEIVALKILKPELAKDAEFVQRFNREALAVQSLNHPNIIRAVQVGKSGDYNFFAMEFVDGETASKMIKTRGKLPERLALSVCRQIALALDHAWKHRVIHRDIKPDNIMITAAGVAKLTDLGLARTVKQESTLTITGIVMGSPAYISPEQATGEKNLDTRSDIYALGASLYHMLTGEVPYDGDSPLQVMLRHMNDPLPDVKKKDPAFSEATRRLIMKMMAKRPEGRFQSPRDLADAIAQVERHIAGGPPPMFLQSLARSSAGMPAAGAAKKAVPSSPRTAAAASSGTNLATSSSGESKKAAPSSTADAARKALGEKLRQKKRGR